MRKPLIVLVFGLVGLPGCDKASDTMPDEMPAARIAPEAAEAESDPEPAEGKGVGAAGCESAACTAACRGFEQPDCAEAFAAGCFTDAPPSDKGCEKFAERPSKKSNSAEGVEAEPEAEDDAEPGAKAPVGG